MPRPHLLFDFGGTLADIHPNHEWLYQRACREFGVAADDRRIQEAQAEGWDRYETPDGPAHPQISATPEDFARYKVEVIVERLRAAGIAGPHADLARRILELDTQPDMYRLYDETLPALEALAAAGHTMAIISNHEWDLPDLIDGLGIRRFFPVIVTSAQVGYRKPHPRIYMAALEALDADPERTVMIGDSVTPDVLGAHRLGIGAVFVERSAGRAPAELPAGVPVVRRLTELPGAIDGLAAGRRHPQHV
jgi:putative hydrolase of the HAD superfamily